MAQTRHRVFAFIVLAAILFAGPFAPPTVHAQQSSAEPRVAALPALHAERLELPSGAELVTILGHSPKGELPLVAVLNDTLGDTDAANDRLRYVWVFSYCAPSMKQRILAAIPFFYHGAFSRSVSDTTAPPVIFDFSRNPGGLWRRVVGYTTQAAVLDPAGWVFMAGSRTYIRNRDEYREAQLLNGLSVLSMFQDNGADTASLFPDSDVEQAYGRIVSEGLAGAFMDDRQFGRAYARHTAGARQTVSHNWELLRQRCEEEGLYFQPIPEPPQVARHAIVWVSADEIASSSPSRKFDGRFLNIASPWADGSLRKWQGYSRTFYVEPDGRVVSEPSDDTHAVEMIPLAVYGLDFPKIPAILVDFRSFLNPKAREISRRAVDDVGRFLLDITPFGDLKYYVARKMFGFVVGRKGVDIVQPSRATVAVQLTALLNLEDDMDPELRAIISRDLEHLRLNPLVNSADAQERIARAQYHALLLQVETGELDRRIERDRARDQADLAHGSFMRGFFALAHVLTLGAYTRRDDSPELRDRYAIARALQHHENLLAEVAEAPRPIEVSWNPNRFLPSLEFVASHRETGSKRLVRALETIARNSDEVATQVLAVDALVATRGAPARAALDRLQLDPTVSVAVRLRSTDAPRTMPSGESSSGGSRAGHLQ